MNKNPDEDLISDEDLVSEATSLVTQAVLTELLARLARIDSQLQTATSQSLQAAAAGLKIVAGERDDAYEKRIFAKAASIVEDMHVAALGTINKEQERTRH
ncbi:hypothetical protein [Chelativorans sp. M5D2P16]|uniref:hypothetical protein n=1 Tax=Chelativorans sp. M5D2P16 TaxID=3095678 RepID=UPI002ACA7BA2|nr:hypothetical protein [Chelativorans sp. M5D2P16]MDZ5696852.1 hypothetical protein [Chelativorans sp. M5D2P16]